MRAFLFCSLILFSSIALAADFVGSYYTCESARVDGDPHWMQSGMFADYVSDVGFNQELGVTQMLMGMAPNAYFAGVCSGVRSMGPMLGFMINWVDGAKLEMGVGFGCAFSGKMKISTVMKPLSSGEEYFSARHTFQSDDGHQIEIFEAVGIKPNAGVDFDRCLDIFRKELGEVPTTTALPLFKVLRHDSGQRVTRALRIQ